MTDFDPATYWRSRCQHEKARADSNLRLAAENSTHLAEKIELIASLQAELAQKDAEILALQAALQIYERR